MVGVVMWLAGWGWGSIALLLSHACFIVPIFWPRARLYGDVGVRLLSQDQVWLTIDDGPSQDTRQLLAILAKHQARATFFLVGQRAAAQPELVHEIVRCGHTIGNHSQTHPHVWFWALGPQRMHEEIIQAQTILTDTSGQAPMWYRSVVGMTNPFVAAQLRAQKLTRVAWTVRGLDGLNRCPQQVLARIEQALHPGAIILVHEGQAAGHAPKILHELLLLLDRHGLKTTIPVKG